MTVVALAAATVLAVPASAGAEAKNPKFCEALYSDKGGQGIDFEGLGPAEAKYAAKLMRKLAKTGVPAKLKSDLGKLAKFYDQIAKGDTKGIAKQQKTITQALTTFSKYTAKNCSPPRVPST